MLPTTRRAVVVTALVTLLPVGTVATGAVSEAAMPRAAASSCAGDGWVASWAASPTDALVPIDATGGSTQVLANRQTFRAVISPHLGGSTVRVTLSNRFGSSAVTFGRATIGRQTTGAAVAEAVQLTFGGKDAVTVPAGADVVSDAAALRFRAFEHLAVSVYVPGLLAPVTKHWNANATTYVAPGLSGDRTARTDAGAFDATTQSWPYVVALDTRAAAPTRSVVAFGDSITDGFVGGSALSIPADASVADTDHRYPDVLQRRLDAAGVPISVVNAGIGSNMLLTSGEPLMLGPAGVTRFKRDALDRSGVAGVLLLEGINDLGLAQSTPAQLIDGYRDVIAQSRAAGLKIWLGTILPSSDALIDGTAIAPNSERDRQQVNAWIRGQTLADGVVDFDRALRDPANPAVLRAEYASVDRLHPSPAGYRAMADAVDLALLATAACAG